MEKNNWDRLMEIEEWKRNAREKIFEKLEIKKHFIRHDTSNHLTLEELSDLAISVGVISSEEVDISKIEINEVEEKLTRRISELLPSGYSIGRVKQKSIDAGYKIMDWSCFITTACVEAANLPDNCCELEKLRTFRDGYIAKLPQGHKLIQEYYEVAPNIVRTINSESNSHDIFSKIFDRDILPSVASIGKGNYKEALDKYASMVNRLKREHLGLVNHKL